VAAELPRIIAGQRGAALDDLGVAAIGGPRAAATVPREAPEQRPLDQARDGEPGGECLGGAARTGSSTPSSAWSVLLHRSRKR
jgi:hypothetical protein